MAIQRTRRWIPGLLGFVLGGALGLLLAVWFRHHLPTCTIVVPSVHGASEPGKVDADLDPAKVAGISYARRETIFATDPPVLRLQYRIREGEELELSNRVAVAFQRPVRVAGRPSEAPRRLGLVPEAWRWILMGAGLFGFLGLLLPIGSGEVRAPGGYARPGGGSTSGWRPGLGAIAVVVLCIGGMVGAAVLVSLEGRGIGGLVSLSLENRGGGQPAFEVQPAGPGRLAILHEAEAPWRVWRGGAETSVPPRLLTVTALRGGRFVDESALPGISRYWVVPGEGEIRVPRGPGLEAWVLPATPEGRAWREGWGEVRVEWGEATAALPSDARMLLEARTDSGRVLERREQPASGKSGAFGAAVGQHPGEIHVGFALGSVRWGTSSPVHRVVAPRAEPTLGPVVGGGLRLTFPSFAGGFEVWRAPGTNREARVRVTPLAVTNGVFEDRSPFAGRSWYWVVPAGSRDATTSSVPLEAWVLEPVQGFTARRDDDGAVRLDWQVASGAMPPGVTHELSVSEAGSGFVPVERVQEGMHSHLYDGGRTNGGKALGFRLRRVSARWGEVSATAAVAAVAPPRVRQRITATDGRFELSTAGVEGAIRFQWFRAPATATGSPLEESALDQLAEPIGTNLPLATTSVVLPEGGAEPSPWYSVMAMNAGGRTRVTEWSRRRPAPAPARINPVVAAATPRTASAATPEPTFTNSLGMRFVPVTTSLNGKQKVLFSIWETRVQDYAEYIRETAGVDGRWKDPVYGGGKVTPDPKCPVVNVSWTDAKGFCQWLTKRDRAKGLIPADAEYRLPTDAEWSWAVGIGEAEEWEGGSRSPKEKALEIWAGTHPYAYPWGKDWPPKKGAGNYADESAKKRFPDWSIIKGYDDGYATTSPVGSFVANPNGLFDLGGNVWEWVEEFYDGKSGLRALRGGSWLNFDSWVLLSSCRVNLGGGGRDDYSGFRVVLVGVLVR